MNITATSPGTGQQTRTIERPRPLPSVMAWELRRFRASRLFWLQALGFFCLLLLVTWFARALDQFSIEHNGVSFNGSVAGTSARGLFNNLPTAALLLLVLLLPFVTADAVTRDLKRRTHELLMTTALPTWAYVWGRYLIALLLLAAYLGMGLLLHLSIADYPAPEISTLLLLWVGMVVSATVLISSISFALGTLLPRQSNLVKIVILLGWFVGAVILPSGLRDTIPPAWYINWDPTSAATALGTLPQYRIDFDNQLGTVTSAAQFQHALLTVENTLPNIGAWFVPHLLLAGFSLLLVLCAALTFKRSRDTLS